ncbi:MAG: Glucosaminyl phosphatidylinositol (GlcN-PI) nositol acylation protein [Sclerophora amabilis]|nr:MAG: Glucosaminyl phosphatidylinositol (GlcN-PI) nositol acylation protein [Sclerophora amabilis]
MANSYKSMKEDFVSNLTGGEVAEINYVTAVAPASALLWSALQSRLSFFTPYSPAAIVTDFLLNVTAILLAITLYSSAPFLLGVLLVSPAILLYFLPPSRPRRILAKPPITTAKGHDGPFTSSSSEQFSSPLPRRPFLTTYRGSMLVITCLAILAVDFRIFPRRFAKVETWGTSLMDIGVGSFVFSAGLVSARPILKERLLSANQSARTNLPRRLYQSVKHSLPLLILGLVRLYSVKNLDYAEHVSEYGVHWNFFFTLGFLPPFVAVFQSLSTLVPSYALLSLIVAGTYQALLSLHPTLQPYILLAPRTTGLISQNREGIFSFFGYLSIFFAGQSTGLYVIPPSGPPATRTNTSKRSFTLSSLRSLQNSLLATLISWSLIWTTLHHFSTNPRHGLSLTTSRRLANLPYVLWVNAFNTTQLLAYYVIERLFFPPPPPPPSSNKAKQQKQPQAQPQPQSQRRRDISNPPPNTDPDPDPDPRVSPQLSAFNKNGLVIFLVANLLTGGVNLSLGTLEMGTVGAMALLLTYAGVLTGVALGMEWWSLRKKQILDS